MLRWIKVIDEDKHDKTQWRIKPSNDWFKKLFRQSVRPTVNPIDNILNCWPQFKSIPFQSILRIIVQATYYKTIG